MFRVGSPLIIGFVQNVNVDVQGMDVQVIISGGRLE